MFCIRQADVQTWIFVLLFKFSAGYSIEFRIPPERKARNRYEQCCLTARTQLKKINSIDNHF